MSFCLKKQSLTMTGFEAYLHLLRNITFPCFEGDLHSENENDSHLVYTQISKVYTRVYTQYILFLENCYN